MWPRFETASAKKSSSNNKANLSCNSNDLCLFQYFIGNKSRASVPTRTCQTAKRGNVMKGEGVDKKENRCKGDVGSYV